MAVIFEYSNISHFRLPFSTREKGSYLKPTILIMTQKLKDGKTKLKDGLSQFYK